MTEPHDWPRGPRVVSPGRCVGIALLLAGVVFEQLCLLAILEWRTWGVLLFTTVCVLGGLIAHGPQFVRWIDAYAPPER